MASIALIKTGAKEAHDRNCLQQAGNAIRTSIVRIKASSIQPPIKTGDGADDSADDDGEPDGDKANRRDNRDP